MVKWFFLICFVCNIVSVFSQQEGDESYQHLFHTAITSPKSDYYYGKMYRNAESGNAMRFLELGYFVNSINEYYLKTGDTKYFIHIQEIFKKLKNSSQKLGKGNKWIVNFARKTDTNYEMLNKEFLLYEGYMFRYLAQYVFLANKLGLMDEEEFLLVKDNFAKWTDRNNKRYGDMGELFGLRVHMGSHWATVALYLYMIDSTPNNYKFYDQFNEQLKSSLRVRTVMGAECYVWNSTYSSRFNNLLNQKSRKYNPIVQDVSHGNHVVQFIIDSYRCGQGDWKEQDITRLINTLKYIIWKNPKKPSDNVDGTMNSSKLIHGTGWKQSDGWMKLIKYDPSLKDIFNEFYLLNSAKINKFNPFPQFYVNMF